MVKLKCATRSPFILFLVMFLYMLYSILAILLLKYFYINILFILSLFFAIFIIIAIYNNIRNDYIKNDHIYIITITTICFILVYHVALWGEFIRLTDNIYEYPLIKEVINSNAWNPFKIHHRVYEMPVVVFLPTLICKISALDLITIYKTIVPLISIVIPYILYIIYKTIFTRKIAFLSSILFLSMFIFSTWVAITLKMVTAILFTSLFLYIIIKYNNIIKNTKYKILSLIFIIGVIFSHYGTAIILIVVIIITQLFKILFKCFNTNVRDLLNKEYIILIVIFTIGFYTLVSSIKYGSTLFGIIYVLKNTLESLIAIILTNYKLEHYTLNLIVTATYIDLEILKYLYIILFFFMIVGITNKFITEIKNKELNEYTIMAVSILLIFIITNTIKGTQYGGGRIIIISAIWLSPYSIIGIEKVIMFVISISNKLTKIINLINLYKNENNRSKCIKFIEGERINSIIKSSSDVLVLLYIIIFFMSNSGLISEVFLKHNTGSSIYLSAPRIIEAGTIEEKEVYNRFTLEIVDWAGIKWIKRYMYYDTIYVDYHGRLKFWLVGLTYKYQYEGYGNPVVAYITHIKLLEDNYYIYLSKFNTETNKLQDKLRYHFLTNLIDIRELSIDIRQINKIYTNQGCEIYAK